MSRRPTAPGAAAPTSSRQNEYFVPRDGIDREVITADICRYLGNDALVRPGTYENPSTGQVIQGYFINAYRNLTTAMIEDLKADSARWDQERRQHSAARSSSGVQYRNSETHSSRQQFGPSDTASGYSQQDSRDQYGSGGPRYPGTGNLGYTGASTGNFQGGQGYGSQAPAYGGGQPFAQSPPHQQQQGNMPPYPGHGQAPSGQFAGQGQYPPYQDVGANSMVRPGPGGDTQMGGYDAYPRDSRGAPVPPGSRPTYTSSGPPPAQGYQTAGGNQGFYPPNQQAGQGFAQPHDPFYGRGGFPQDTQQYETAPAPSRTPTSTTAANIPPAAPPSSSHGRQRDSVERDPRQPPSSSHRHTSDRHGSRRT